MRHRPFPACRSSHHPIKDAWERNGSDVPEMTGDDFGAFVTAEVARWAKVVQDAGVKVE